MDNDIPYLLLTPGPLTTSRTVKQAMMQDYCTWDSDYNFLVDGIRSQLVALAGGNRTHTTVLMQGSGTFAVESTIGSVVPPHGKLLVLANGAYGRRIRDIATRLKIPRRVINRAETTPIDSRDVESAIRDDPGITHVALVHCETTTGLMNPAAEVGEVCQRLGRTYIVDAMSSFGGIPLSIGELGAQFLISSANKCLQGVPGFGFVIADRQSLAAAEGWARSLSLDLFDQWRTMETHDGKWRFTSPTHAVRAFAQALAELDEEGGISARYQRYCRNQQTLVEGMEALGFCALIERRHQSPIITSFRYPPDPKFRFSDFYEAIKRRRFIIYPGKVSDAETFRIGSIGHVFPEDFQQLLAVIERVLAELGIRI
jgi:2-aminoethylphosphonate-pyruvate transaminase